MTLRTRSILVGGALCALTALLYTVDPSAHTLWLCPVHTITGLQCAGCGMTRAAHELLHGHIEQALHFNVLSVVVLPLVLLVCWRTVYAWWHGTSPAPVQLPRGVEMTALVVVLVYMVMRNAL
jgi:uncharacterized membrane protein YhdT